MGGSLNNIHNNVSFALRRHFAAMVILQEQASTGSRINRASDAPTDAYRILGLNTKKRYLDTYMESISTTVYTLNMSLNAADQIKFDLAEVKKQLMTVGGADGGSGTSVSVETINSKLEDIVAWANSKHLGQYLFGGSNTATAPYAVTRDSNGKITNVTYQGSLVDRKIEVASGVESSAFIIGDNIFRLHDRQAPVFSGVISAAAGTGTSSVTGFTKLTVEQDADPDKYKLSIDGTNYVTVLKGKGAEVQTLDFGGATPTSGSFTLVYNNQTTTAIQYDDVDTDIQAALIALTGLDTGDVTVTGTYAGGMTITFADTKGNVPQITVGTNILDGGGITITPATTTQGIGDTNLAVADSNGKVLYVDTTGITGTGTTWIKTPGTYDIFNTLITIRDRFGDIATSNVGGVAQLKTDSIAALEEGINRLVQNLVSAGLKINFLENLRDGLDDIKFNAETEVANLEDADIAQIAIDLSRREILYQMSLAVAGRMLSMSLLDFI